MAEHFKLPWRMDTHSFSIYSDGAEKGPARVADMRGWGYLTGKGQGALGLSEDDGMAIQQANAAFIVKAVNNHDALVQALTEAAERLEARGHNFGAREARKALDAVLPTAEDVRGILAPVGSPPKP